MDFDQLLSRPPIDSPPLSVIIRCMTGHWLHAVELASATLGSRAQRDEIILWCPSLKDLPPAYVRERRIKVCVPPPDDVGLSSAIALARNPVVAILSDQCPVSAAQLNELVHRLSLADICVATRKGTSGWFRRPIDTLWRIVLGIPIHDPLSGTVAFRRVLIERILLECKTELAWLELFAKATYAVCLFDEIPIESAARGDTISQLLWRNLKDARTLLFPGAWLKEESPRGWMNVVADSIPERNVSIEKSDVAPLPRRASGGSLSARDLSSRKRSTWGWKPRMLGS